MYDTTLEQCNHFQKTFFSTLASLIEPMWQPGVEGNFKALLEKAFCRSVLLWCNGEPNEAFEQNLSERILQYVFGADEGQDAGEIRNLIRQAGEETKQSILNAPYRIASDFGEAADYMIAFAGDSLRRCVAFGVETGYAAKHYAIVKMPYSDRIDFFYGTEYKYRPYQPLIGNGMDYLGFRDNETGILYDLREPMALCWFHNPREVVNSESGHELSKTIKRAIQIEVAHRVRESVPSLPDLPPPADLLTLLQDVEKDYSHNITAADFADKVNVDGVYLHTNDPVFFIEAPDSLIAERADEYMKSHGGELEKRWIAHCAAQKILSYTAVLGDAVRKDEAAG